MPIGLLRRPFEFSKVANTGKAEKPKPDANHYLDRNFLVKNGLYTGFLTNEKDESCFIRLQLGVHIIEPYSHCTSSTN